MILRLLTLLLGVTFLALSLREAGYHVVVNAEASGAFENRVGTYAVNRMQAAGVQVMNFFSINGELFRDWRSTDPSAAETVPFLDHYIAAESWVVRLHAAAVENGTIVPGQMGTVETNGTVDALAEQTCS